MNLHRLLLPLFFITISISLFSQDLKALIKSADYSYEMDEFHNAKPIYEKVLALEPNNDLVMFRLGVCYLHNNSFEKALELIENAQSINPSTSVDPHYNYWYGIALHKNMRFDDAIVSYATHESTLRSGDSRRKMEDVLIQQSKNAKSAFANPEKFSVNNMGDKINSNYNDHTPLPTKDNLTLFYTSQKPIGDNPKQDAEGRYYEKIYVVNRTSDGAWGTPSLLSGELETEGHDAAVHLYDNDTKMLVHKQTKFGDLYIAEFENDKWTKPKPLRKINSNNFELDASITGDGNTIYFASAYHTQNGNFDIFYAQKNDKGEWGSPQPVGELINTLFDEISPYISSDGNTLYFSSDNDKSIGGYDVFVSYKSKEGAWSAPKNLGVPINSVGHDVHYHVNEAGVAYIASHREGGAGELDIYDVFPIKVFELELELVDANTKNLIKDSDVTVLLRSKKGATFPSKQTISLSNDTYKSSLLSDTDYELVVIQNGDTLLKEDYHAELVYQDGIKKKHKVNVNGYKKAQQEIVSKDTDVVSDPKDYKKTVYFAYNKVDLNQKSKDELDPLVSFINNNKGYLVQIEAHTDNIGSQKYNLKLSKKRAKSVANYLTSKKVDSVVISQKSFGKEKPIVPNDTEENRQLNRRAEIKIIQKK